MISVCPTAVYAAEGSTWSRAGSCSHSVLALKRLKVVQTWHLRGFSRGLRLLGLLGVGAELLEAVCDVQAVLACLLVQLWQLLDQLSKLWWRQRHGQHGGGEVEVEVTHQHPAAFQALSNERKLKQKALYRSTNVGNWAERHAVVTVDALTVKHRNSNL